VSELLQNGAIVNTKDSFGNTPLHLACAGRHLSTVQQLLRHGASLNTSNRLGKTPFDEAKANGRGEVVKLLKDVNASMKSLLSAVVQSDTKEVGRILCEDSLNLVNQVYAIGPENLTLLQLTLIQEDLKMFETLLAHKADPSNSQLKHYNITAVPLICVTASKGNAAFTQMLLNHDSSPDTPCPGPSGAYPLSIAIARNHTNIVALLLRYGAKTDIDMPPTLYFSILGYAAFSGKVEIVRFLINEKFDLEKTSRIGNSMVTPLGIASLKGHDQVAEALLQNGANANAMSEEGTPLCLAAKYGYTQVVRLLLKYHADIELASKGLFKGATPLFMAATEGHADTVQLLVDHGANVNPEVRILLPLSKKTAEENPDYNEILKTMYDYAETLHNDTQLRTSQLKTTALVEAVSNKHTDVVRILVKHGANTEAKYDRLVCRIHASAYCLY
jgi:hypothetical protein